MGIFLLGTHCLLGQKVGGEGGRDEGEGSICFELVVESRHRRQSIQSPRKQFRKQPPSLCGTAEGRRSRGAGLRFGGSKGDLHLPGAWDQLVP